MAGARAALGLTIAATAVVAVTGCGGGSGAEHPKVARFWPPPRESVDHAIDRIAADACRHPSQDLHGLLGTAPRASSACANTVRGLDLRDADVEVFGTGATATVGDATLALVLDRDRRFKIAFREPTGDMEKTPVPPGETVTRAVDALSADRCEDLLPYAFVYLPERKWCRRPAIRAVARDLGNDASAIPRALGGARGILFYGIETIGPHYWTMVLAKMRGNWVYYDSYSAQ